MKSPIQNARDIPLIILLLVMGFLSCKKQEVEPINNPPEILELSYSPEAGVGGTIFTLSANVVDTDGDEISYFWNAKIGEFIGEPARAQVEWKSPELTTSEMLLIELTASDGELDVTDRIYIMVNKPETGWLSGIVHYKFTTVPIEGVIISVGDISTSTNGEGEFYIEKIPVGSYTITAVKEGFDMTSVEVEILYLELTEEKISLSTSKYSTTLEGIVIGNQTSNHKEGLKILMLNPDGSDSELLSTSDAEGYYSLESIPQGLRRIIVRKNDLVLFDKELSLQETTVSFNIDIPEPFEFTDGRDGNTYQGMKIGSQIWMNENLAYLPSITSYDIVSDSIAHFYVGSYYGTDVSEAKASESYKTYGVLYNWHAAVYDPNSSSVDICPDGWHLPSNDEWKILEETLGMSSLDLERTLAARESGKVGLKLKSTHGWDEDGSGSNLSGFNALPAGFVNTNGGFLSVGSSAHFWTATPSQSALSYFGRTLSYSSDGINNGSSKARIGKSVRCIKDE
ncbi:MAG: hypothetical protein KAH17_08635 [Bacteroidales bacterium]|nr:hypothetical protein [Bacteroidales bacterium]